MRRLLAIGICLVGASCPSVSYLNEAELARDAKTVVHEPEFTLFSPYDDRATADYAETVRAELALVRTLLPERGSTPVRLYLVPIDAEPGHEDEYWRHPAQDGLKGMAREGDCAFVYVTANTAGVSSLVRAGLMRGDTVRHELTHLCAHRAGLHVAPWFEEGIALEVQSMRAIGDRLIPHPFPPHLVMAREKARPGVVSQLWRWRREEDLSSAELSQRYVMSQALVRFLIEDAPGVAFEARARAIMQLDEATIVAREAEFLDWLAKLDALERIRLVAQQGSVEERAECVGVMPILAASGVAELKTRVADEFALELLRRPECLNSASTFLLFFRARDLRADDLAELERSGRPPLVLTAIALHARRGEPTDTALARTAWAEASASERDNMTAQQILIPGLREVSAESAPH